MAKIINSQATANRGSRLTALLVSGDIIAFIVFATLGRGSHGEATGLSAPIETLGTAAPFIAGWLLVAPWLGVYGAAARRSPAAMAGRTALAWLLAWPVALGLRALFEQRGIPLSFAIVAGSVNLILLVGWRTLLTVMMRRAR